MMPHRDHETGADSAGAARAASREPGTGLPLEISHAQMNAAYGNGEAVPFAHAISWLARYDGSWWILYERGWLRVTDGFTASDLDRRAAQMTSADAQAARDTVIRSAVASQPATAPAGTGMEEPFPPRHS